MSLDNERTTVTSRSRGGTTRMLLPLVVARVVNRLGGFSMGFLGARLSVDLGAPMSLVGPVLAIFGLCTIPSRVLGGVLAHRIGSRRTLVVGLLACALAQAVVALAGSVATVVLGAVLLGLAQEIIEPATQGFVAEQVPAERRASGFALLSAAMSVAGVLAGAVAGLVAPFGVAWLFGVDAITSLAAAAVVAVLLVDVRPPREPGRSWRRSLSPRLLAWTGVGTVYGTLVMVVVLFFPLSVVRAGHPTAYAGWLLAVVAGFAVLAQRAVAHLETRVRPALLLVAGYVVLAGGLALWATGTVTGLLVGAALEGASGSLLLGTQQAVAAGMARPGDEAAVMTTYGLSWGVAAVLAPLVGAPLLERGPQLLWGAAAALAGLLAAGHLAAHLAGRVRGGRSRVRAVAQ